MQVLNKNVYTDRISSANVELAQITLLSSIPASGADRRVSSYSCPSPSSHTPTSTPVLLLLLSFSLSSACTRCPNSVLLLDQRRQQEAASGIQPFVAILAAPTGRVWYLTWPNYLDIATFTRWSKLSHSQPWLVLSLQSSSPPISST